MKKTTAAAVYNSKKKNNFVNRVKNQKYLLIMLAPCLLYYILFRYIPMFGLVIAFNRYNFADGIFGSPWVGLDNFSQFIFGPYFWRLMKNTFLTSFYDLLFGFPAPIIFALMLNELAGRKFKRLVQTVSYLPHFLSAVVVVGLMKQMLSPTSGIVNAAICALGGESINFFMEKGWFRFLYVISGIWQNFGWGAIIYIAGIAAIDPALYEAAEIDGAKRFKKMIHITIPGITPTMIILLILRMGTLLDVGYEKVLLMYNPGIYETADVISTYVYRNGIQEANYSFGTAVGLMNSVIAMILIIASNTISKRVSETSLW